MEKLHLSSISNLEIALKKMSKNWKTTDNLHKTTIKNKMRDLNAQAIADQKIMEENDSRPYEIHIVADFFIFLSNPMISPQVPLPDCNFRSEVLIYFCFEVFGLFRRCAHIMSLERVPRYR